MKQLRIILFLGILTFVFIGFSSTAKAAAFNDAADGNWNLGATWGNGGDDVEGSGYPGSSDTVTIDSHTVTMTADHSTYNFTLSGGTLTMDSYTLTATGAFTESSGTFNEDTGTLAFTSSGNITIDVDSSLTLNNVTVNKNDGNILTIASGDTLVVNGTTTLTNGNLNAGTLNAKGSISIGAGFDGGGGANSALLLIDGAGDQSFTVPDGASLPAITLNQAATTIDFADSADVQFDNDFTLQAGIFTASNGTLTFDSASLDTSAGGTFNHNSGTILSIGGSNMTFDVNTSLTLNNLTINRSADDDSFAVASGDTLVVNGTLTLTNSRMNTGTINVKGAISVASTWDGGSGTLLIDGASAQSFTVPDGAKLPATTLNQAATTIDFDTDADATIYNGLTLQAGTITASSGTLTFDDVNFNTSAGGTFNHNSGTILFIGGDHISIDVNTSLTLNNVTINKSADDDVVTIASGDTLAVNGTTTLTNGNLSTGTLDANGDVTIASTWDTGSSPITFSGSSTQTLTGSSAVPTSGTVSISSGATVALGANTTITTLTIDSGGTLDLAGYNLTETTFTNNGTLQLEGGETVNEPDTHGANSIVEYNDTSTSQTLKNWTYTGLTCSATGQTVSMGNTETLAGNLVVSSGTFDTADNTLSINGNTTISGGTLMTGTGVLTFGDAGGDSVTISSGTLEIESDATDTDITINAGTWDNSGGTISYTGSTVTTDILSSLSTYNNLTINSTGSTYTQDGAIDIDGNFTLTAGTLDSDITNNYDITLAGNWANSGTFTSRSSTTTLDGTVQSLTGTTSFYNLKKIVTASSTLSFGAGETTTITNDIWLTGTDGNLLILHSTADGTQWSIDPQGTRTISYIDVKDSNNENTTAIDCIGQNCTNAGNNTNWTFVAPTPTTPTIGGAGPSSSAVIFVNGKPTTKYKTGTLVKYPEDPKVYLVNGNILQYIPDEKTFNSLGYLWTDIIEILNTDIIVKGSPLGQVNQQSLTTSNPKTDKLIKYPNSPKVYLLKNSIKYWIVSEEVFNTNGYKWDNIELLLENKQYPTGFSIFE